MSRDYWAIFSCFSWGMFGLTLFADLDEKMEVWAIALIHTGVWSILKRLDEIEEKRNA